MGFPDDHIEVQREKKTNYIRVSHIDYRSTWSASRRSKKQNKTLYNGSTHRDEKTAAHASDTLARKLMENGERDHKLNFPDDYTEVDSRERKYQKKRKRQGNTEILSN